MALTKVSGGILDPGINVAGIVTATGFDGPFTGGSSSNINAGIITATGFDLNGNTSEVAGSYPPLAASSHQCGGKMKKKQRKSQRQKKRKTQQQKRRTQKRKTQKRRQRK